MSLLPRIHSRHWTRVHAGHLLHRAGFGASPELLDRLSALAPEEAVGTLFVRPAPPARETAPAWFHEPGARRRFPEGLDRAAMRALSNEERQQIRQRENRTRRRHLEQAGAWWLGRMIGNTSPLEEKLTLFLHGHFATSAEKVRATYPMLNQHFTFREQGMGSWRELIEAVAKDPAMLVYLDNARSNRRNPNENFARELMELFTLGEGHYTEEDVHSAARAFTGWSLSGEFWQFQERPRQRDDGLKTFLSTEGRLNGGDVIELITRQPRAHDFLVERLWRFFANDTPDPEVLRELSRHFRDSGQRLEDLLRALFLHPAFYEPDVRRVQIKSPVQLIASLHLAAGVELQTPAAMVRACRQLGQTLFAPPSVKGWDGGAAWITASTLAQRYALAETFLRHRRVLDPGRLFPEPPSDRTEARAMLFDRFYQAPLRPEDQARIDAELAQRPPPADWSREDALAVTLRLVQSPQFQLC